MARPFSWGGAASGPSTWRTTAAGTSLQACTLARLASAWPGRAPAVGAVPGAEGSGPGLVPDGAFWLPAHPARATPSRHRPARYVGSAWVPLRSVGTAPGWGRATEQTGWGPPLT